MLQGISLIQKVVETEINSTRKMLTSGKVRVHLSNEHQRKLKIERLVKVRTIELRKRHCSGVTNESTEDGNEFSSVSDGFYKAALTFSFRGTLWTLMHQATLQFFHRIFVPMGRFPRPVTVRELEEQVH